MQIKKLSVLVPAYNEENTIEIILSTLLQVKLEQDIKMEIIVVNDCSKDHTAEKLNTFLQQNPNADIKIFHHEKNKGKGAALHTAIQHTTGDYMIVQDADLEYDPNEFNILLQPVLKGKADVVYGSRFMGGNAHRILFFWHSLGNKMLTFFSNVFSNLNLTDMETCYKLISADIFKNLKLKEKRFGFEPEVTQKLANIKNIRIYEVGISYYGRTYAEGKKINWKDGFRALYCILKYGLFK
ncbi:MAG: glycosyltransferase family 2 protein [Fimbriimonadaceae bacterium]|nr:glycosyltransferase family 2 protein [Chitinophagales bacterium]